MAATEPRFQSVLSAGLGLRPLDRVQVISKQTLRESRLDARWASRAEQCELPWWFFQRYLEGGLLEVATPGGYLARVGPTDICDVRRSEPVIVQAMPHGVFLRRLQASGRPNPPEAHEFSPAYVLRVSKDRWGQVDMVVVAFLDPALDGPPTFSTPVCQASRRQLQGLATRKRMPVISRSSANYSADHGEEHRNTSVQYAAKQFVHAALSGQFSCARSALLAYDLGPVPMTTSALNRALSRR